MNISTVRSEIERVAKTVAVLNDSESLIGQMSKEVRTISHLPHPPLLDEADLASAIRWYIDGFAERSHIKVDLDPTISGASHAISKLQCFVLSKNASRIITGTPPAR